MVDITALGELLIDFTEHGRSASGMRLFEQNPGGAVANVVCAGARLGLRTAFIGKVGDDIHGHFLRSVLDSEGVDIQNLIVDQKHFTTLAFVSLNDMGERDFSFYRKGAADVFLEAEDIKIDLIENTRILHVGTISMTDEPARHATLAAVIAARRASVLVSCDINYRAALWESKQELFRCADSILPMVDLLKVSSEEAELLTGEADPAKASLFLMRKYPISVIAVTSGERGAYIRTHLGSSEITAIAAKAIDTTGAGDSFWAAFLYAFLKSGTLYNELNAEQAKSFAEFAAAAASLCIESRGAIPSMPHLDAVLARMGDML